MNAGQPIGVGLYLQFTLIREVCGVEMANTNISESFSSIRWFWALGNVKLWSIWLNTFQFRYIKKGDLIRQKLVKRSRRYLGFYNASGPQTLVQADKGTEHLSLIMTIFVTQSCRFLPRLDKVTEEVTTSYLSKGSVVSYRFEDCEWTPALAAATWPSQITEKTCLDGKILNRDIVLRCHWLNRSSTTVLLLLYCRCCFHLPLVE